MKKFLILLLGGIIALIFVNPPRTEAAANTTCSLVDEQLLISFQDNTVIRYNANSMTTIDSSYYSLVGGGVHPHEFVIVGEDTLWQANDTSITPVTISTGTTGALINVGGTPNGLTIGPDGYVYAYLAGPAISRTQPESPFATSIIIPGGTGGLVNEPFSAGSLGIEFGPDGNLYVISIRDDSGTIRSTIKRYDGATFAYIDDFVAETAGDWQDFSFHTDGYIYVADYNNGVFRYDAVTGTYVDQYSNLSPAYSIKFSPSGNLLLTLLGDDVHLFSAPNTSTVIYNQVGPLTKVAAYLPPACYDWGDAANSGTIGSSSYSHPVTLLENAARHLIQFDTRAGSIEDEELDGQPSATADGDDAVDDEDGVVFSAVSIPTGTLVTATFTADGRGVVGAVNCGKYLNVWVDLNGDGDWDDASEQVVDGGFLGTSCSYNFSFTPTATDGPIMIRARYSSVRDLNYTGGAPDGEVEDYAIVITSGSVVVPVTPPSGGGTTVGGDDDTPGAPDTGFKLVKPITLITFVSTLVATTGLAVFARKLSKQQ